MPSNKNLVVKFGLVRCAIQLLIRTYQNYFSFLTGNTCRFYPSCSQYALHCFLYLPFYKAFWYSVYRLIRCNPYAKSGEDFPPHYCNLSNEHTCDNKY